MDRVPARFDIDRRLPEPYRHVHRGVIERLADPYLTEHDRWVLGQFERFLSGRAPDPDPREPAERSRPLLYARTRRSTL